MDLNWDRLEPIPKPMQKRIFSTVNANSRVFGMTSNYDSKCDMIGYLSESSGNYLYTKLYLSLMADQHTLV